VLRVPSVELDDADHGAVELDHEEAGPPPGHLGHLAFEFGTGSWAAEMGVHLR